MKKILFLVFVFFCSSLLLGADSPQKQAIQKFVDSGEIPGAIGMIWKDGNLQIDCVGWADVENKVPMTEKNIFWIASMTKALTGTAVMMLVDEGKLSLDDPVDKYLPEFQHVKVGVKNEDGTITLRAPKSRMTVRQVTYGRIRFPDAAADAVRYRRFPHPSAREYRSLLPPSNRPRHALPVQ